MARSGIGFRLLTAFVALALTVFSLGFTWAVVDDYSRREIVPKGATVEGLPVGGMTRAEAVEAVRENVEKLLVRPLAVEWRGKKFTLDTAKYLTVDVEGMVDETFKVQEQATLPDRVYRRVTEQSVPTNVTRKLKLDSKGVERWLADVASKVDTPAVDSTLTVIGRTFNISKAIDGYNLDRAATLDVFSKALVDGKRNVALKVDTIKPKMNENSFGKTLLIIRGERHLWLYDGPKLEVDYPVAVGTPGYPTPLGWWTIINKRRYPTWTNPGSAWAKGMPAYIGPGYYNPLGTRALDLNASGIRIHGSAKDYSIGTAASHGCMRMHMSQIEDLFERVPVGTRCIIVQ
jgi:lipoprotein-anchoring transpeptidase ErfK/SrfK